jgi:hypothetical protein
MLQNVEKNMKKGILTECCPWFFGDASTVVVDLEEISANVRRFCQVHQNRPAPSTTKRVQT